MTKNDDVLVRKISGRIVQNKIQVPKLACVLLLASDLALFKQKTAFRYKVLCGKPQGTQVLKKVKPLYNFVRSKLLLQSW